MRILITGSRDWPDNGSVEREIAATIGMALSRGRDFTFTIVHGDCPTGADYYAKRFVEDMKARGRPVDSDEFEADWDTYGPAAGPIRNKAMVDSGADICLAFAGPCKKRQHQSWAPHASHGTNGCVELCDKAGIEVSMSQSQY